MFWLCLPTSLLGSLHTSSQTFQIHEGSSRRSIERFWGFLSPNSCHPEEKDDGHYHQAFRCSPCITFSLEDMQIKEKHDRPLYYTGYIDSSEVSCIQVDSGSALSIMSRRVIQHIEIPTHRLSAAQTFIYGFNANGTLPMGKIKLRCQIGDLKSELMCYVIDVDMRYNLLLGRPWIHRNSIVQSTLHQVMKYADEWERVRTLIAGGIHSRG